MTRSAKRSTASQTTTSEPAAVPLIGGRSGGIGSDKMRRALMRERGGVHCLTDEDKARIEEAEADERRRAIETTPWRKVSLSQLLRGQYDLPQAVVARHDRWRDQHELLPPDLSEEQIADVDDCICACEGDMMAAGPKATAVILRRLAACVILPDRDPDAVKIATEAYLEDLQGYPEHILLDVTKDWRRTERFWPTIAELRERCNKHPESLGVTGAFLKQLYLLRAVANNPAPDMLVSTAWVWEREDERRQMVLAFDRFTPRKRIETDKTPKLALAS